MRKLMLVFLMLFLPLQWTAALAADCCLRHDAQTQEHHAQQAGHDHEHQHHAKADTKDGKPAGKMVKNDCQSDCAGCHVHHCAVVLPEFGGFASSMPADKNDTPYVSGIASPVPDNLFRPPLSRLA